MQIVLVQLSISSKYRQHTPSFPRQSEGKWKTFLCHSQRGASLPIWPSAPTSPFTMMFLVALQRWAFQLWPHALRITLRFLAAFTPPNRRPSQCSNSHSLPVMTPASILMLTTARSLGAVKASIVQHQLRI